MLGRGLVLRVRDVPDAPGGGDGGCDAERDRGFRVRGGDERFFAQEARRAIGVNCFASDEHVVGARVEPLRRGDGERDGDVSARARRFSGRIAEVVQVDPTLGVCNRFGESFRSTVSTSSTAVLASQSSLSANGFAPFRRSTPFFFHEL